MVKFVVAQRKLCDYVATRFPDVSKIFSHGIEVDHPRPQRPRLTKVNDPHHFRRDEYKEKLKLVIKREDDYKFHKKLAYGILWKHCSLALQNSIVAQPTILKPVRTRMCQHYGRRSSVYAPWE